MKVVVLLSIIGMVFCENAVQKQGRRTGDSTPLHGLTNCLNGHTALLASENDCKIGQDCDELVLNIVRSAPEVKEVLQEGLAISLDKRPNAEIAYYLVQVFVPDTLTGMNQTYGWYKFDPVTKQLFDITFSAEAPDVIDFDESLKMNYAQTCE